MTRPAILMSLALAGCIDPDFEAFSCNDVEGDCAEYSADEPDALIDGVNSLSDDLVIVLGAGTFALDGSLTLRGAEGITLKGQGQGETTLDFSGQTASGNGIDVVGDRFTLADLTVLDAQDDGVRIEDSARIAISSVEVAWSNEDDPENGAYGLYPVRVRDVLVEDSFVRNASDAGIYVGQCERAIVRNNIATGNVAGIELENTQYADVHGNTATGNTGGLLVFDLPGNPIVGRDISVHDNTIGDNNRPNFAGSGTVRSIPAGTGTFVMASRRVEISGNIYADNGTVDIAVLSGLALEGDLAAWALDPTGLTGDWDDLGLDTDTQSGAVLNFRTNEIYVHDNAHSGSGTLVDAGSVDNDCLVDPEGEACTRPMGVLIKLTWGTTPVDEIVYDTIGESAFDAGDGGGNSNDNHVCVGPSTQATFASLNLPALADALPPSLGMVFRPASPFSPFDCSAFTAGPIADVAVEAP